MKTKFKFISSVVIIMTVLMFQSCGDSFNEPNSSETVASKISTPRMKTGSEGGGTGVTSFLSADVKLVRYTYSNYYHGDLIWKLADGLNPNRIVATGKTEFTANVPTIEDTYYVKNTYGTWIQVYKIAYFNASGAISATGVHASFENTSVLNSPDAIVGNFRISTYDKHARVKCQASGLHPFFNTVGIGSGLIISPEDFTITLY